MFERFDDHEVVPFRNAIAQAMTGDVPKVDRSQWYG
jgi:hypothetical protein